MIKILPVSQSRYLSRSRKFVPGGVMFFTHFCCELANVAKYAFFWVIAVGEFLTNLMYACRCPFLVVQDFNDHHDSFPVRVDNFYLEFCSLCWQSHPVMTWTSPQGGTNPQKSPPKSLDSDENICYFVVNSRFCRFVEPHMHKFLPRMQNWITWCRTDWHVNPSQVWN